MDYSHFLFFREKQKFVMIQQKNDTKADLLKTKKRKNHYMYTY